MQYKKITFHRIPKDMNFRRKWIIANKRKGLPMADKSSVCSEHFLERELKRELLGLPDPTKLKPGAFPSMIKQFEKPRNLQTVIKSRK